MTDKNLELAEKVLMHATQPMTPPEIWEEGKRRGFTEGNTWPDKPAVTLRGVLGKHVRERPQITKFAVTGTPAAYYLKSRADSIDIRLPNSDKDDTAGGVRQQHNAAFDEAHLHPLLAWFVRHSTNFHGGKEIYTKTIEHTHTRTTSKTRGLNQWSHPDMVGVYFHFRGLKKDVVELSKLLNSNPGFQLFSFELKKKIDNSNYRESFFQAVSNSSWAHEGYLVAAQIEEDKGFRQELERLSNAFGIGIILLDTTDASKSSVLFAARNRKELDWDTINKLNDNGSFEWFTKQLGSSLKSGDAVNVEKYDKPSQSVTKFSGDINDN